MNHSNYASLDELIAENNLLKEELNRKDNELVSLTTFKNTFMPYHASESNIQFSDNDNDYWNCKMKEYGVNSVIEAMELINIEAIENNDTFGIEGSVYYDESDPKNINFLKSEDYNIYMLSDCDYPERLYSDLEMYLNIHTISLI